MKVKVVAFVPIKQTVKDCQTKFVALSEKPLCWYIKYSRIKGDR